MSDNKRPSYPWYPRDFAADEPVQLMSLAEEGAYRRLLDHQWLNGSIPGEIAHLAKICKNISTREMRKIWTVIEPLFSRMPGQPPRLQNGKLERVREEKEAFLAAAREAGKRGGETTSKRRQGKLAGSLADSEPPATLPAPLPATLPAEEYPAFATASASAINSSVPTEPARAVAEHNQQSCMGLVVKRLYFGNRPPPDQLAKNGSVLRNFAAVHGYDRMAKFIEGLAILRDRGELFGVKQREPVSLLWLNAKGMDLNQLARAEDAYYKHDPPDSAKTVVDGLVAGIVGKIGA